MNRILHEQQRRNADSRSRWECFSAHRCRVTDLLLAAAASGHSRLCVLGAGNCNDLDLSELVKTFVDTHLDEAALVAGVAGQGVSGAGGVHIHGGVDLTGCIGFAANWTSAQPPADADLQACLDTAATHPPPPAPGPFDVVASVCLLSQLIDSIAISLGGDHPRFLELVACVRLRHLRMLFELLAPGGTAILITDFVSSETYPPLATATARELPALAAQLIQARNFFTGTNPAVLHTLFKTDDVLVRRVSDLEVTRPWLWDFGPRTYAVCAITAKLGNDSGN